MKNETIFTKIYFSDARATRRENRMERRLLRENAPQNTDQDGLFVS